MSSSLPVGSVVHLRLCPYFGPLGGWSGLFVLSHVCLVSFVFLSHVFFPTHTHSHALFFFQSISCLTYLSLSIHSSARSVIVACHIRACARSPETHQGFFSLTAFELVIDITWMDGEDVIRDISCDNYLCTILSVMM